MSTRRYLALPALAGALFGVSFAAFAQTAEPPAGQNPANATAPPYAEPRSGSPEPRSSGKPPSHRRHRSAMARALGGMALSPDQRTKIHGLMHSYRASRTSGTPETRKQLIAQIEGILTPGERSEFETRLHRAHQAHRPPANGSVPAPTAAP